MTSLLCALAPNVEVLIAARALQGVAGALLVPSTLALIIATFPPAERGAAIGSWTAWTGIATVIGPLAGGVLIDNASWRWIFAINVDPGGDHAVADRSRGAEGGRAADAAAASTSSAALLCALGLGGTIFALIEQPRLGWDDPLVAVDVRRRGRLLRRCSSCTSAARPQPMLPLSLFRSRNFAVGNVTTLAMYAGLGGMLFLLGIFVQQVAGYSALEAGAAFLPVTALMFALSKRFGALADRYGPRLFMAAGPIVAGVGMLLMLRVDAGRRLLHRAAAGAVVFGLGLALTVAPLTAAVLAAVDDSRSGVASGRQQRGLARRRPAGDRGARHGRVGAVQLLARRQAAAAPAQSPAGQAAVESAREGRPLAVARPADAPPPEREAIDGATTAASVDAFHLGMGVAALITMAGGIAAAVGIGNPRRVVDAEHCPGGAICGAPERAGVQSPAGAVPEPV